ncbi:MAG: HesB/IscA family protein [Actinomycetota bacterium]
MTEEATIGITASAASKVTELLDREISAAPEEHADKEYALRVAVQPGGCAGLRYALYFDDRKMDGDVISAVDGVEIRVDRMSAPYLRGAQIDYLDTLEQSGFTINNPNAKGSCACGESAHF